MSPDNTAIVLSNIAVSAATILSIVATGAAIWVSVREANRHSEKTDDGIFKQESELIHVIDETLRRDHEMRAEEERKDQDDGTAFKPEDPKAPSAT